MTMHDDDRRLLEESQRIARIGSFEWNIRRQQVRYSAEMYRLYGMTPGVDEPLDARRFLEVLHPDDRDRVREVMRDSARTGKPFQCEYRLQRAPDRIFLAHVRFDYDPDGTPVIGWGTVQDVTEQRAESERRRRSEERMVEAELLAQVGSFDYALEEGGERMWSVGMYRLMGVDPSRPALNPEEFEALVGPEALEINERAFYEAQARGDGFYTYEYSRVAGDGRRQWIAIRAELYETPAGPRMRGTAQDITDRRRAAQQHAELAQLALGALRHGDLDELFQAACDAMARSVDAPLTSVLVANEDGSLRMAAGVGWEHWDRSVPLARDSGSAAVAAYVASECVVVHDWRQESRYTYTAPLRDAGVATTAALPLFGRERPYGVIAVHATRPQHFDDADLGFLESLAGLLGTAVERLRAEAEVTDLAQMRGRLVADIVDAEERVRRRISELLHDGALQDLLAARQDLVEAQESERQRDELLAHARQGIERAVSQLRDAVRALHPVVLEHGGLPAALQAAGEAAARRAGFAFDVEIDEAAVGVRDQLVLSMAGELIVNAAKHAGATRVSLRLERRGDELVLELADDGVGVEPDTVAAAPRSGHIGLASLVQRAEAIGGRLDLASGPKRGTTVRVHLPID